MRASNYQVIDENDSFISFTPSLRIASPNTSLPTIPRQFQPCRLQVTIRNTYAEDNDISFGLYLVLRYCDSWAKEARRIMIRAVVGLNWGDEGKGRIVDMFAGKADVVIRFQGGDNAGHTVVNDIGKFAFHNFPSGICFPEVVNIIAAGSVINPDSFIKERDDVTAAGVNCDGVRISDRATLIMPYHYVLERLEDERLGKKGYGSTMSGIAPSYADRYAKKAIQVGELLNPQTLRERITDVLEYQNMIITGGYGSDRLELDPILDKLATWGESLKPYIADTGPIVEAALERNSSVILEAQLGALRDVSHGIYPYTTSSSVLAGYAAASVPIPPKLISTVTGITKAYSTCVGAGAFTTEILDELAGVIREKGKEYGAKTGRPRRIGRFDAVATRYGAKLQSADEMIVTCLDVLSEIDPLRICVAYEIEGKTTDRFPIYPDLLRAKPVYETLPGWQDDITEIRRFNDLPANARTYVRRIEELVGTRITNVSVGPERNAIISMG